MMNIDAARRNVMIAYLGHYTSRCGHSPSLAAAECPVIATTLDEFAISELEPFEKYVPVHNRAAVLRTAIRERKGS